MFSWADFTRWIFNNFGLGKLGTSIKDLINGEIPDHPLEIIRDQLSPSSPESGSSDFDPSSGVTTGSHSNSVPDDYYGSLWNELGDWLGIGSAGMQAVWNAKMQDWQNAWNEKMTSAQNAWDREQWNLESDFARSQQELQNQWSAQQTSAQNAFNALEAQKERDWQEYMSNTSYSRAVDDLARAGLNPILAVGGQMSSSSGASASGTALGNQALSPTAKQATSFISSVLGANGVAAGYGLSGLSQLANSAMNVFRTGYLLKALDLGTFKTGVRGISKGMLNVLKYIK